MKKILIIQSYKDEANALGEQRDYVKTLQSHASLVFISSLDTKIPWGQPEKILEGYEGVILGGSSDFDFDGGRNANDPILAQSQEILKRLTPLLTYVLKVQFPCMGICYGHQIMALINGGSVANDKTQNKLGSFEVQLTEEGQNDEFFKLLPNIFMAQYDHKDSVVSKPENATLLGEGERCRFSILRYGSRCYTIQFHVEFTDKEMYAEYRSSSERFPTGIPIEEIVKPSPDASKILPLFVTGVC